MAGDGETRGAENDARELVIKLPAEGGEPAVQMRFCDIPAKGHRFRMGERGGRGVGIFGCLEYFTETGSAKSMMWVDVGRCGRCGSVWVGVG